jgi:processive 1,2-diacylglycerol beta-glucosyltransferase
VIELRDVGTGRVIGPITEEQLQFLVDQLQEESSSDTDFYIDAGTLEMFEERGADAALLSILRAALGAREGSDVEWVRA